MILRFMAGRYFEVVILKTILADIWEWLSGKLNWLKSLIYK